MIAAMAPTSGRRTQNEIVGWLCSVVTLTPFSSWRRQHAGHHAVWNNLDQRHGGADIYSACLTRQEYLDLSPRRRWFYRITRHPVVAQLILPPFVFLLLFRVPFDTPRTWRKERRDVHFTKPSARDHVFRARRCAGLETGPSRAAAGRGFCLYRGRLAVLSTAPV